MEKKKHLKFLRLKNVSIYLDLKTMITFLRMFLMITDTIYKSLTKYWFSWY